MVRLSNTPFEALMHSIAAALLRARSAEEADAVRDDAETTLTRYVSSHNDDGDEAFERALNEAMTLRAHLRRAYERAAARNFEVPARPDIPTLIAEAEEEYLADDRGDPRAGRAHPAPDSLVAMDRAHATLVREYVDASGDVEFETEWNVARAAFCARMHECYMRRLRHRSDLRAHANMRLCSPPPRAKRPTAREKRDAGMFAACRGGVMHGEVAYRRFLANRIRFALVGLTVGLAATTGAHAPADMYWRP